MNSGKSVFSQIMNHLPMYDFRKILDRQIRFIYKARIFKVSKKFHKIYRSILQECRFSFCGSEKKVRRFSCVKIRGGWMPIIIHVMAW